DSEVPLPTDAPVELQSLRPCSEAIRHERGIPTDLRPRVQEIFLFVEQSNEPLARRYEFEWAVAFLEKLDRSLNRRRLSYQRWPFSLDCSSVCGSQQFNACSARLFDRFSYDRPICAVRCGGIVTPP